MKDSQQFTRRDVLQWAGTAAMVSLAETTRIQADEPIVSPATQRKRVIIAGGGIGGLCCAFELMERGHDVTVLEAAGRAGGHMKTICDPLPDGLYADVGAEHFTKPGYEQFWKYVDKFQLPFLAYPRRQNMVRRIDGKWHTEEQLQDPAVLRGFGFSQREIDYIVQHGWTELPLLYLGPYLDTITDEYQPFVKELAEYDEITASELLLKDGASDAALRFNGLRRGDGSPAARNSEVSALFRIWQTAIVKHRKLPVFKREVFRLRGGNQLMTDTFAKKLGERLRLGCPISAIQHGDSGVTVQFTEFGDTKTLDADYLVSCIPPAILRKIPVTPAWPAWKEFPIQNVVFGSQARVLLQSRTPFWKGDPALPSINLETGESAMYTVYETADEVLTPRRVLMGSGSSDTTAEQSLAAFTKVYPGKQHTIEQCYVHNWAKDPWAFACERYPFPLGQLQKFWPHILSPVGRIHFAGNFADNLPWGMDAATRSANRVADAIHRL